MNHIRFALYLWFASVSFSNLPAETGQIDPGGQPRADEATVLLLDFEDAKDGNITNRAAQGAEVGFSGATPAEGKFGKGLSFDGEDDFVDAKGQKGEPSPYDFTESANFTVEFYMKGEEGGTMNLINKKLRTDEKEAGWMVLTTVGKRVFALLADGTQLVRVDNPALVFDGEWHHVALVVDRKEGAVLYVDGTPGSMVSLGGLGSLENMERALRIGDRAYDGDFKGEIDEVRISNVARPMKQ